MPRIAPITPDRRIDKQTRGSEELIEDPRKVFFGNVVQPVEAYHAVKGPVARRFRG
jgi:hypothetical protein